MLTEVLICPRKVSTATEYDLKRSDPIGVVNKGKVTTGSTTNNLCFPLSAGVIRNVGNR